MLIWFTRWRRATLVTAIGLHLMMELTMNLHLFQWFMIVGWLSFLRLPSKADSTPTVPTDD
jgi:hypothetical protein